MLLALQRDSPGTEEILLERNLACLVHYVNHMLLELHICLPGLWFLLLGLRAWYHSCGLLLPDFVHQQWHVPARHSGSLMPGWLALSLMFLVC